MLRSIALAALLGFSLNSQAIAPLVAAIAVKEGMDIVSDLQDGVGDALDILDLSEDIAAELGEGDGPTDDLSLSLSSYNRQLNELKDDMRSVGYTEEQINDLSERLNTGQNSLTSKMRALKRTIVSVKRLKNTVNKLFNNKGSEVAVQRGLLSTQQQALHLQMQQMQQAALRELQSKRSEVALRKATEEELNKTTREIAKKNLKLLEMTPKIDQGFKLTQLQRWAVGVSLVFFLIGCFGVLFGFLRDMGWNAMKAGLLGWSIAYLLPGLVHFYRLWLGV